MNVLKILGIDMSQYFPDVPRVFTALAEWLACVVCIAGMRKRMSRGKQIAVFVAALIFQVIFLSMTGGLYGPPWFVCMAAAIAFMYFFIFACSKIRAREAGYYLVHAFVASEFAVSLEWQLDYFSYYDMGWKSAWFRLFWLVLVYGGVFGGLWLIGKKHRARECELQVTGRELASCIVIGLAVFLTSYLGFVSIRTPLGGAYYAERFSIRTIVDLGGLAILYAYHVQLLDFRTVKDFEMVQTMLHNQYVQYQQSQEVMDVINYKYHDLKHFILALKAGEGGQEQKEYLARMEEEIHSYEIQNKTGNEVLDTLLTTKNLYCMRNDISMTNVIDGALFDFMDAMDICSIFGNALDNAIECEEKIQEKEKRLIHVLAYSQKQFLLIRFENYCEGELKFDKQFPLTTKKERMFHGYGLKSLVHTVHKYGGEVDVDMENNWFSLQILIPLQDGLSS